MQEELKIARAGVSIDAVLQIEDEEMSSSLSRSITRRAQEAVEILADDLLQVDATVRDTDSNIRVVLGIENVCGNLSAQVHVDGGLPAATVFNRLLYGFHQRLSKSIEAAIRFDQATRQLVIDVGAGRVADDELPRRLQENRAILGASHLQ